MEASKIAFLSSDDLYEPKEINKKIIDEETNSDWLFYRDIINSLFKEKMIDTHERYCLLLTIRKQLGLFVL